MAAIDLLLEWSPTSERMHQVVLAGLLKHTGLLCELGIEGDPTEVETESHRGLFDLTVAFSNAATLNLELKLDASLSVDQMERQMAHIAKSGERLLYLLLGATQYCRPATEIEQIRSRQEPSPSKNQILVIDLASTVRALRSLAAAAPDPDRRDLAAAYGYFLRRSHETHEAFPQTALDKWRSVNWFAFFNQIRTRLKLNLSMGYVANPTGGFAGCWWGFTSLDRAGKDEAYLQLEEDKLCFKVHVGHARDRGRVRNRFSESVIHVAGGLDLRVQKPHRFGSGDSMTAALFGGDYRCANGGDKLDWGYVSATLSTAQKVLRSAVADYRR